MKRINHEKNITCLLLSPVARRSLVLRWRMTVRVKFIGDIIDAGCDVVNDLSNPLEVQMGQIAKTAF
ncbi:Fimbrial protein [Klebsiella michiganensis]|uniref:Fimbrial protein n=1 Tax=Klebsiella michiganensis TaxID=1134687 RepID=A0A7H4PPA0_9ENTR|nr:Fimbrial protein [Klebsiella michiganensis]